MAWQDVVEMKKVRREFVYKLRLFTGLTGLTSSSLNFRLPNNICNSKLFSQINEQKEAVA